MEKGLEVWRAFEVVCLVVEMDICDEGEGGKGRACCGLCEVFREAEEGCNGCDKYCEEGGGVETPEAAEVEGAKGEGREGGEEVAGYEESGECKEHVDAEETARESGDGEVEEEDCERARARSPSRLGR